MVVLAAVEGFEWDDLGDDAVLPGVGGVELRDVGFGDALLVVVGVEDGGAVGGADVRALAVEGGGVVDGEEDAEELAVGEARGIVDDLDGLGVVGGLGGDVVVVRGVGGAAGVAGGGGEDAFDALDGPIVRLTALDTPVPFSPPQEEFFLPKVSDVIREARKLLAY